MVVPLHSPESDLDLESQGLLKSVQLDRIASSADCYTGARIQVRNLSLVAQSGQKILDEVSFEVHTGKIVGLIGPSGSGKSTLLRALNRLWEPEKGAVLLDGVDITTLDVIKLRRRVGMLFQTAALFDGERCEALPFWLCLACFFSSCGEKKNGGVVHVMHVNRLLLDWQRPKTSSDQTSQGDQTRCDGSREKIRM